MRVHELLRPFHEAQVAQVVYAELVRSEMRACPGRSHAGRATGSRGRSPTATSTRSIRTTAACDWIDWFDVFAIVDRFETAPKVPFVQAFFTNAQSDDDLRENVFTHSGDRPPPGWSSRGSIARRYRRARQSGGRAARGAVRAVLRCTRRRSRCDGARPTRPSRGRARAAARRGRSGARRSVAAAGADRRSTHQLVLDTADVEVSSTEFGLMALFVGRKRGDYTKDFAISPYLTERGYGVNAGPRGIHFGPRNDAPTPTATTCTRSTTTRGSTAGSGRLTARPARRRPDRRLRRPLRLLERLFLRQSDQPARRPRIRRLVRPDLGGDYGFVRFRWARHATPPLLTPRTIGASSAARRLRGGDERPRGAGPGAVQPRRPSGRCRACR